MARKTYIDPSALPSVERATLRRIASYLQPYFRYVLAIGLFLITSALLDLLPPWLIKRVIDSAVGVEGLVIKRLDEPYQPGKRGWLKLQGRYVSDKYGMSS